MTVAALSSSIDYLEDGVSLDFPVPFRFLAGTITATRVLSDGTVEALTYGTHFSTSGGDTDAGGTLTLLATVSGATLRIRRATPRAQTTDYPSNDVFPSASHELALDRSILIDQEQDDKIADLALGSAQTASYDQTAPYYAGSVGARLQRAIHLCDGPYYAGDANGATEVTDKVLEAIADARARKVPLLFGDKSYKTAQLPLTNDNYWFGDGATIIAADPLNQDIMHGSLVDNIYLRGLILDGDKPATTSRVGTYGQGIHLLKGARVYLENVEAIDCLENPFRLVGIDGGWAKSCVARGAGHNGMYISGYSDGSADFKNFNFWNCETIDSATDGFALEFGVKNVWSFGHRSTGSGRDHSLYVGGADYIFIGYSATQFPENCHLISPYADGGYGGNFYVLGLVDLEMVNPVGRHAGTGCTHAEVTFGHGLAIYASSASMIANRKVRIVNPDFDTMQKHGIWSSDNLSLGGRNNGVEIIGGSIRNPGQMGADATYAPGGYDGINAAYTDSLIIDGTKVYDDQVSKTMRRPLTVASTCANPRINAENMSDGTAGGIDIQSTTAVVIRRDATGRTQMSYGAIGTAAVGARLDIFEIGTGGLDRKLRNSAVTIVEQVDSGAGYYGTLTSHDLILLINNAVRARIYDNLAATETAMALVVNDGTSTTLRRVSVGAADSGGSGFRLLRVSNS